MGLTNFVSPLRAAKDAAVAAGLRRVINTAIKEYGRMLNLRLDPTQKRLELELDLAGETSPIRLTIGRYQIVREAGGAYVVVDEVNCSRPWITTLAANVLAGRRLPIDPALAGLLEVLV